MEPGTADKIQINILNRSIGLADKKAMYESDLRHTELMIKIMEKKKKKKKKTDIMSVLTLSINKKLIEREREERKETVKEQDRDEEELDDQERSKFRVVTSRVVFLTLNRFSDVAIL